MAIITLTSDLGDKDFYVGSLKGEILKACNDVRIIDISHNVPLFEISQAAFILRNSYRRFPKKTIHVIAMGPNDYGNIGIWHDGHYFFGPDNGVFSLIFDNPLEKIISIEAGSDGKSAATSNFVLIKAACHIANGGKLEDIGIPVNEIERRMLIQPVVREDMIVGNVLYVDAFKNLIININKELFDKVGQGRPFKIYYPKRVSITKISQDYSDVESGEALCLFGSSGFLEIAINKAPAATLLGIGVGEPLTVEFL